MDKSGLKTAVDLVLNGVDEHTLRALLEHKTDTIYYLVTLKNKVHKNPVEFGICAAITNPHLVAALSPTWKHYSGNRIYPIPGNDENQNPTISYYDNHLNGTKWVGQQKYYRFSLIDHLLKNAAYFYKEVEKRLNN